MTGKILVGLTGGIGSGKSVVARMFTVMGLPVYDSDSQAKRLMDTSPVIRRSLCARFGDELYAHGTLNRVMLAARIFGDDEAKIAVNGIVHPAVKEHFEQWASAQASDVVAIESALLRVSGLDRMVDVIIRVDAPDDVRVARVMTRSALTAGQVTRRMAAQARENLPFDGEILIVNDDVQPLIPQVTAAVRTLKSMNVNKIN